MRRFIVAVLGVAALAGCGATAGSQAATTTTTPDVTAIWRELVQCLRANGMPNLPDPRIDADGQPHFPGGDPGDPPPQAERACMPVYNRLPASVRDGGPEQEGGEASRPPADIPALLRLARCMREQGMPDWPDPRADGTFPLSGTAFEREGKSPRFLKAARACARFNPDPSGTIHGS